MLNRLFYTLETVDCLFPPKIEESGEKDADGINDNRFREEIGITHKDYPYYDRTQGLTFFAIHESGNSNHAEDEISYYFCNVKIAGLQQSGIF